MVNVIYPRTVSIRRPKTEPGIGVQGYGGVAPMNEIVIASGLIASIQYERVGLKNVANLPTDSRRSTWLIIIPVSASPSLLGTPGLITENDIVVDDLGKRYQVYAADWQVLAYNIHAQLLTV